ncbi:MAG TPA: serine/threonine-protein kinase, partial [Bryobacteraceae bacterium]|nr:serine/threonine-protein kinase [Bryobacteraceae bacterium]
MNPERWRQITAILHPALALAPEARAAFLQDACGTDAALRQEVESLIAAAEKSAWIDGQAGPAIAAATATMDSAPLPEGGEIGPYRILHKLGEGGMGVVYKAVDTRLGRTVALKLLLPDHGSWQQRMRFAREAKAASALNHPNIVTIYEFDTVDGVEFIAMEYVDGESLFELQASRRASRDQMLGYLRQAAGGIAKAHEAGMIHRDLKPNNIMVTKDGTAKVLDFGLARMEVDPSDDPEDTRALTLTRAGTTVGTPSYMSPEQVKGEPVDRRTDIFSFGIILYEVACGQRPFKGANAQATLHQIATIEPRAAAEVDPTVPAGLTDLIARCLQKDPEKRVITMADVARDLGDVLQPAPAPAAIPRRRVAVWAGAALLAV